MVNKDHSRRDREVGMAYKVEGYLNTDKPPVVVVEAEDNGDWEQTKEVAFALSNRGYIEPHDDGSWVVAPGRILKVRIVEE